jgi:hypothetical protein
VVKQFEDEAIHVSYVVASQSPQPYKPLQQLCSECVKAVELDKNSRGCHQHIGSNACRGDPTKDQDYLYVKDALIGGNYKVCWCDALSPKDVCVIRKKLLAGKSVVMLGAYVMIIIAIRLFLRSDEVLTIEMKDFIIECFVREGGHICGHCIKIMGKTDKKWKYYWIWVNDEFPSFVSFGI